MALTSCHIYIYIYFKSCHISYRIGPRVSMNLTTPTVYFGKIPVPDKSNHPQDSFLDPSQWVKVNVNSLVQNVYGTIKSSSQVTTEVRFFNHPSTAYFFCCFFTYFVT